MSQYVDRNQVLNTTKVRTSLKNDGCWIQRSEKKKEEQDEAQTDLGEETGPTEVKQKSYVLSTAKKFESVNAPVSPPPKQTTEGESATLTNGEVILPQDDDQPGGSTVETINDTKPQAPTEELIQNGEAKPENPVADAAEENKEGLADAPVDQSNVEDKDSAAEISADIHVQNEGPTFCSAKENPEAAAPAEPAEQPVVTAESEGEHADTTAEQSNPGDPTQPKVSADARVEDPVAETSDVAGTGEKEDQPHSVEPIPDLLFESLAKSLSLHPVSDSLKQSAANTTVESEESNVKAAAPAEAGVKSSAVEMPESEVQTVDDTAPENTADPVHVELDITDAVEPVAAPEGGAVQSVLSDGGIELTDALDVEPPTTEAAPEPEPEPEPVDDPEQTHSEEATQNQSDDTNTTETFQKPREEQQSKNTLKVTSDGKAICSFCDQIIDGRIKISFSEPLLTCHAECLKCGVCAKGLGELLIPMFLRDQLIQCDGCFLSRREA
ncbi:myristoylated alanine-rich C-kinase substrate [Paralichthys olivaceus]|uniref:myristoylated alanine-rich C-kinase substrate n=1 Tax=Paralichthys olivaceus TaxID=8255 RepID=UPI003752B4A5